MHVLAEVRAANHGLVKKAVALMLTFAAGGVDIVGYLTVYHTFAAHMTGDTVHLGNSLVDARWMDAALAGSVIAAFLFGSIVGRVVIEMGTRSRVRRVATANLLLEAALIVLVVALRTLNTAHTIVLLAILGAAMGLQTATLTRIGSLTVHTTFVTGMLNKLAQLLSHAAFVSYDMLRGRGDVSHRSQILRQASFIFSVWFLYLAGAVFGTWMRALVGVWALAVPVALISASIAVDRLSPLSLEEEHDEPER